MDKKVLSEKKQNAKTLPGQERYVAETKDNADIVVDSVDMSAPAAGMWTEAWRTLRKNPMFIISAALILFTVFVALFPQIFTKNDPMYCNISNSLQHGDSEHPFGYNHQGCDVYSRVIYGTRISLSVGILTTVLSVLIGGIIGALAGFYGKWVDAVLSRITDIFFAIPFLLGAIVVLQMFRKNTSIWKIVIVLALFGWVQVARITRS